MTRYGGLFDLMFTPERMFAAYYRARRGKRGRDAVLKMERNLGGELLGLSQSILSGEYAPMPYTVFEIREPKLRTIYAPAFRDVVVQHEIYRVIYPIFNSGFIDHSYACRLGYGTHRAADTAWRYMKEASSLYFLQLDIKHFFYSIDREILHEQFARKIKDRRLLRLMEMFTDYGAHNGIPIGNLLSQLYALVFLNPMDHFIKRELKMRRYVRYADDFVLLGLSREEAEECLHRIRAWLCENLKLELSRWTIQPAKKGMNFVGYRMWPGLRLIRKRSLRNFHRAVRRGDAQSVVSLLGHARKTHTLTYMLKTLRYNFPATLNRLPKTYKRLALEA